MASRPATLKGSQSYSPGLRETRYPGFYEQSPATLKGLNRSAASSPHPKLYLGTRNGFPPSDPERVAILQPWVARNALPRVLRTKPGNPERVESTRRFFPSSQVVLGNELIYSYLLSHARPHNGRKDSRRENKHGMSKESLDNRKAFGKKGHIYEIEPSCFLLQVLDPEGVRQDTTGKNKKSSPSARHRS
jgi:hypothetical protein